MAKQPKKHDLPSINNLSLLLKDFAWQKPNTIKLTNKKVYLKTILESNFMFSVLQSKCCHTCTN